MAIIAPFSAIHYPQAKQSDLVAPPYDVLSAADKQKLLNRNPANIVAIDLPHIPPKEAGPDATYEAAAKTLQEWLSKGTLIKDAAPAIYPYQQTYTHAGVTYKRRGFFARVKLEDFGPQGTIHPHEQTFSGPKEDRLKLMRATKANLSPVFGLYDDPANDVTDLLFEALGSSAPMAAAELPTQDGKDVVLSEIWAVRDAKVIDDIARMMAEKHLYIADGHHRYTTCLNYRKELKDAGKFSGDNDNANYAMFVLIAMQDPGLVIMPTHRVVAAASLDGFYLEKFEQIAGKTFDVIATKFNGDSLAKLEQELPSFGAHAIGVYDPVTDKAIVIKPKSNDPIAADKAFAGKSPAWRQLDVAILQHVVFEKLVEPNFAAAGQKMAWAFPHEAHEVTTLCRGGQYRVGFLLQPTPLTAVRDLCNANELMPQKSTFFYPKLATGLVVNSLS